MESRKRVHAEDVSPISTKKRAISNAHGSPSHVNGVVTELDEPNDNGDLELFRKEAIFRRMKHYSRENQRSERRIEELEERRDACEAGFVAMQACWTELIDAIRLLVSPEALPPVHADTTANLLKIPVPIDSESSPVVAEALRDKLDVTKQIVASFVQSGSQMQSALLQDDMYRKCREAQIECTTLRSDVAFMRAQLVHAKSEKEKYHEHLMAAETRLDRLSSRTNEHPEASLPPDKLPSKGEAVQNGLEDDMTSRVKDEDEEMKDVVGSENERENPRSPTSPARDESKSAINQVTVNGAGGHDTEEDWETIASHREQTIEELERKNLDLEKEITGLHVALKAPSYKFVKDSEYYTLLMAQFSKATYTSKQNEDKVKRVEEELTELRTKLKESEEAMVADRDKANTELQTVWSKRDAENVRLRDQRDRQTAEITERKHRDAVKLASLQEYKALAESRSERIAALESEVKRLRTRLAANTGDEDFMAFCIRESGHEVSYVDDLQSRLRQVAAAEVAVTSLQQSLSSLQEDPDLARHVQSEAEARQQVAQLTKQLEKYHSIYGDISVSSSDLPDLPSRLRSKEEELQKMRLQIRQQTQAETALYAELDKLSAAWEALDKQVRSKVFDLSAMEERLMKMGLDKAKLENKFYAAMRDKEAIETERKNVVRNLEKSAKAVERLVDAEKNLIGQVTDLERELADTSKVVELSKKRSDDLEAENTEFKSRLTGETQRAQEYMSQIHNHAKTSNSELSDLRKQKEILAKSQRELERLQSSAKNKIKSITNAERSTEGGGKGREAELQSEVEKLMKILKCSTCGMHMRNTVITKCMHSFCKECVEARITTRQRKCPACNLPFAQSDVQSLFFQ